MEREFAMVVKLPDGSYQMQVQRAAGYAEAVGSAEVIFIAEFQPFLAYMAAMGSKQASSILDMIEQQVKSKS